MSQLILIITESCNLRCKYCVYSTHYPYIKGYSDKVMSFDVAKKAIDFYMELHEKRLESGFLKKPVVTFYGGEALLEFELLKKIVNYCEEKKFAPSYNITTNGTIMNEKIINFLIDNQINVAISFDGNKEQHDRNRVFSNKRGSFEVIFKNICKLQEEKKKRNYKQALLFLCCYDTYTDMEDVVNFFDKNHDLFEPYSIMYNKIHKYKTSYYNYCDNQCKEKKDGYVQDVHINSLKRLRNKFTDNLLNGIKPPVALTSVFSNLIIMAIKSKGEFSSSCNACTVGSKIAVDPEGLFYVCERMAQTCSIGDVENGINFDKVNQLQNKFLSIINEKCIDCPLSRLCDFCYIHLAKENKLEFDDEFCRDNKMNLPKLLTANVSILESNPNSFDDLMHAITPEMNDDYK